MKLASIAAALLFVASNAPAQVMIETKAERAERCEATMPALLDAAEVFAAQYEADTPKQTDTDTAASHIGKSVAPIREMQAVRDACSIAAPAIGNRAAAITERLQIANLAAHDRLIELLKQGGR